jgi:hypothetical protein
VENALATDENMMTRRERKINFIDCKDNEKALCSKRAILILLIDCRYCINDRKMSIMIVVKVRWSRHGKF